MNKQRRVLKMFWAWNDDKEENWLEEMASAGWHLAGGPFIYRFEQGAPARVRYRLDYRSENTGLDEYVRLCRDAGWERVFQFGGWQYFRTASADAPEIYTDVSSRIAKYRRLMAMTLVLAISTTAANVPALTSHPGGRGRLVEEGIRGLAFVLSLAWVYIVVRLAMHIRALKRQEVVRSGL